MSYRIKVPAKTLPVDEAHMLSWLDHTLHGAQDYRRPLLVGLGVLVLAAAVVGGVFYVDRQAAQKAQGLEQEAMRFLTAPSTNDPQKTDHALKEAIARYRQIVDQYPRTSTGTLNRDQALFELARLEESQSRPEGALARYQELIKTYPNSPFTSEATIRTKIMDAKKSQESTPASTAPSTATPQENPPVPSPSTGKKKS